MTRALPKIHAGSPLFTNAHCNRQAAAKCYAAGMTVADIAAEWPEVFRVDAAGKLGQIYDYELADGSGRYETNRRILATSVTATIAKYRRQGRAPRP